MAKRLLGWSLLLLAVVFMLTIGGIALVAHRGLQNGRELLAFELWPQARQRFNEYLWLHPRDDEARFLLAESYAKDDSLSARDAALAAIEQLAQISDHQPRAAEARLRQGQLEFLILQRPIQAERSVRQAIALGADELAAQQMLWTIYNATGRGELAEEIFWRLYELSSESERPERLRDWYLSLFFPAAANAALDRQMGVLGPNEEPTRTSESRRYLRFRESEPEALVNHAALARWCQLEGDLEFAARLLDSATQAAHVSTDQVPTPAPVANQKAAVPVVPQKLAEKEASTTEQAESAAGGSHVVKVDESIRGSRDPFYLSTAIGVRLDLGQFEQAEELFRQWPDEDRGHFYHRCRALILDEVKREHEQALAAYEEALSRWPGPADWRLQFRKAGCLTRLRRTEEANRVRDQAQQVQALMGPEAHEQFWQALHQLPTPSSLQPLVTFYQTLGRTREVAAWQQIVQNLPASPTPTSRQATTTAPTTVAPATPPPPGASPPRF